MQQEIIQKEIIPNKEKNQSSNLLFLLPKLKHNKKYIYKKISDYITKPKKKMDFN